MLVQHLFERYPDRIDDLDQWRTNVNIYVSFTLLPKIGINPQSGFDTPLGIYAYPLREMITKIEDNQIPYAGDMPYIQVLESTQVVELSQYTDADLERDVGKLKAKFGRLPAILNGAKDDLQRYLHMNKEWPSWQYGNEHFAQRDERIGQLILKMNETGETFDFMVANVWGLEAKPRNAAGKMWNITRNIAKLVTTDSQSRTASAKPSIVAWNVILRSLGYAAFSDRKAMGLIHSNEPISVVFLSTSAFKHLKTIHNVRKYEPPQEYARLAQATADLIKAASKQSWPRTYPAVGTWTVTQSGLTPMKLRKFILDQWPKLIDGSGENIISTGFKFRETLEEDFPEFMQQLLKADFDNQLPRIASELGLHNFFDSVPVVRAFLAIHPTRSQLPNYLGAMLGTWITTEAVTTLETIEGLEEAKAAKQVGTSIIQAVLSSGIKFDQLKTVVGNTYWWRLIHLVPEDQMRYISALI
jgi:hypothetical protein